MSAKAAATILSHWHHRVEDMPKTSHDFYTDVERALATLALDGTKVERVNIYEGSILSAKRQYLQVRRKEHVFHICAAPFGRGFFVSWWLGEVRSGLIAFLAGLPYLGRFIAWLWDTAKPITYYRVDTALMFQTATHAAVMEAVEAAIDAAGSRALTADERRPVMRDFFAQLAGGR